MLPTISSTPDNDHQWDPSDPQFEFVVGEHPSQRTYSIGMRLLAHYSAIFRGLIGTTRLVKLPGENAEAFYMVFFYLVNRRFFDHTTEPGLLIEYDQITDLYDIGRRYEMPLIMNAAINLVANKIKIGEVLPSKRSVEYIWDTTPKGCTLRRLLVDLVREMWVPDGNRLGVWADLVGGMSFEPDDLVWAIDELNQSDHTVRISHKTITRLLACEWHTHEDRDVCEGAEEFQLLPEHPLRYPAF